MLKQSHPTQFVQVLHPLSMRKSYRPSLTREGEEGEEREFDPDGDIEKSGQGHGQGHGQGGTQEGITEEGFLELMRLFLQRDYPESNWVMLRSLGYSFTYSFTHSFIHSFTHSLIHSLEVHYLTH